MSKLSHSLLALMMVAGGAAGCSARSAVRPSAKSGATNSVKTTSLVAKEVSLSSHDGDSVKSMLAAFEASKVALDAKLLRHKAYAFWSGDSSFSGVSWEYQLDVRAGVVEARRFAMRGDDGKALKSWTELGEQVGAHDGGVTTTLDTLYEKCQREVLTKSTDENLLYLTIAASGELNTCVYVPKGCADDCSEGVRISKVEWR